MESGYRKLGALLKRKRDKLRLTQAAVGALTNMSRSSYADIEAGRQRVQLHQIKMLAKVLWLDQVDFIRYF